ncbi:MAG: NAD(P)-dependent oxidoreductase [Myxococcales bacterium]|nr:NAD(P)-dependent oxidoreductase [Myxococcales bacterium]
MSQAIAVIGATGRVGRALQRRFGTARLRGLARTAPIDHDQWDSFIAADRSNVPALTALLDGCAVVIDLCAFDASDSAVLANGWAACKRPPHRLILASSLAERAVSCWHLPIDRDHGLKAEPGPTDAYGMGKRAARLRAEAEISDFGGQVISLLLPQLVAPDDPHARELTYLKDAQSRGLVRLPGSGQQQVCVVSTDDVATIIASLAGDVDLPHPISQWQVAPSQPSTVIELVEALLAGANLSAKLAPMSDLAWRGPHSAGAEVVDGARLRALLPTLTWQPARAAYLALGRQLQSAMSDAGSPQ